MSKEIVKRESFLPLVSDADAMRDIIEMNLGGEGISAFDLPRIAIPASGGLTWTIPTPDGEVTTKELTCIIAATQSCRGYWPGDYAGSTPPACSSMDGKYGDGQPGGPCAQCPFAQWDSGRNGRGQACKAMRRLFLILPGTILPYVLTLAPTSLRPMSTYMIGLTSAMRPYCSVVTGITLAKKQNADNIAYSIAVFQKKEDLSADDTAAVKAFREAVDDLMDAPVSSGDYAAGEPIDI